MDEQITVTRSELFAVFKEWENEARAGKWETPESVDEHAHNSADELIKRVRAKQENGEH